MLKKLMSLVVCSVVLVANYQVAAQNSRGKVKVVANGKSNYAILISQKSIDSVKSAAKELQDLIQKVGGVKLPIKYKVSGRQKYIVIGKHPLAAKNGIKAEKLIKDSFIIREKAGNVFLIGRDFKIESNRNFTTWSAFMESDSIGSYFATMEFARRFLGVEWYMPSAKGIAWQPRKQIVVPGNVNIKESPHFSARFIDGVRFRYESTSKKLVKSGMFRRNYFDAQINKEATQWGRRMLLGNNKIVHFGHAWWQFMPPTKGTEKSGGKAYGKTHPEYYALQNGQRQNFHRSAHYGAQLCVSNPDVVKTYADNIIAYAKKHGGKTFSMSENDGGGECQCKKCLAMDGKDPVTGKLVSSNRFVAFANNVAALVVKEIPDVRLGIYAYNASLQPPTGRVKIHPNVYISDVYNYLPNLWYSGDAERNKLIGYMEKWRKNSSNVSLTSYYNIYGNWGLPWDTTEVIGQTIQILGEFDSSIGMALYNCRYFGISPGVAGARLWVLARLYWNPKQDINKLRNQYYRGAFGPEAGKYIKQYFDTINRAASTVMEENPINIETDNSALQCTFPEKIYAPIRQQCRKLINKAVEAGANSNERIKWRIDRVAKAWEFTELTLDSFLYAQMARTGAYVDTGLTLAQTWERAVQAGQSRREMLNSRDSHYAMAQGSADYCQVMRPLGVIEKIPANLDLDVAVPLVTENFVIDGKLDDKVWQNIPATRNFKNNKNGKPMPIKTWAKIFRTADVFVIGFYCAEPKMNKLVPNIDPNSIWVGDVAEVFISQTGTQMDFVQFLANAISVKKAFIMRGDRGMDNDWNPKWQAKGHKGDKYWSVEMSIPFKTIGIPAGNIKDKTIFINFCRERYADGDSGLYAWSPTKGAFAQPAKFGRMAFNVALANLSKKHKNNKPTVNILPGITSNMRGWDVSRIGDLKRWQTTSKVIDGSEMVRRDAVGGYKFVIKDNKPPMTYVINLQQPIEVKPGDKFQLEIAYKRNISETKLYKNILETPQVRVSFDEKNHGKQRIWFTNKSSNKKVTNWQTIKHKIYIDPSSNVSKMWIKLSLFGENNSLKNIKLSKLQ